MGGSDPSAHLYYWLDDLTYRTPLATWPSTMRWAGLLFAAGVTLLVVSPTNAQVVQPGGATNPETGLPVCPVSDGTVSFSTTRSTLSFDEVSNEANCSDATRPPSPEGAGVHPAGYYPQGSTDERELSACIICRSSHRLESLNCVVLVRIGYVDSRRARPLRTRGVVFCLKWTRAYASCVRVQPTEEPLRMPGSCHIFIFWWVHALWSGDMLRFLGRVRRGRTACSNQLRSQRTQRRLLLLSPSSSKSQGSFVRATPKLETDTCMTMH